MANEKKAYSAWINREKHLLSLEKEVVAEAVKSASEYDSIDFLIDLLASTVIGDVADYLETEYIEAYNEGVDGLAMLEPSETEIAESVYAVVDGMDYTDRIEGYVTELYETVSADPDALEDALRRMETSLQGLVMTDGHRVRGEARLQAGEDLSSVGFTVRKRWNTMADGKVRDVHVPLHGVTIPINSLFSIGAATAKAPGGFGIAEYDCGCRCVLEILVS